MEMRSHARLLANSKWFILLLTVATGVAALVFGVVRPVTYKAVVSFDVAFPTRQETLDYQYGAYYELKAAEIFVQHLMSSLRTPAVVEQIYQEAGLGYEIDSISRFTNRFQAKQYSAQNFSVTFTDRNRETAETLATAVVTVVEKRAKKAGTIEDEPAFAVTGLKPVVAESEFNLVIVTLVGILAGLVSSIILVYLREYFR
jgi:capsular polysaccharide biosynthesis protein